MGWILKEIVKVVLELFERFRIFEVEKKGSLDRVEEEEGREG